MIEDCKAGKIDLIVTKSVSRFARNVVDCIKYARDLRALSPPVGIYFETENINTLSQNGELLLPSISWAIWPCGVRTVHYSRWLPS